MKRLKTFEQHKAKIEDVKVKPVKPHAADKFTADEMDGLTDSGTKVDLLTDEEKEKNITKQKD